MISSDGTAVDQRGPWTIDEDACTRLDASAKELQAERDGCSKTCSDRPPRAWVGRLDRKRPGCTSASIISPCVLLPRTENGRGTVTALG